MLGNIILHKRENVAFTPPAKFKSMVRRKYGAKIVEFTKHNDGMYVDETLLPWTSLASDLEWFDDAEVVTDKNGREVVMTWLNLD